MRVCSALSLRAASHCKPSRCSARAFAWRQEHRSLHAAGPEVLGAHPLGEQPSGMGDERGLQDDSLSSSRALAAPPWGALYTVSRLQWSHTHSGSWLIKPCRPPSFTCGTSHLHVAASWNHLGNELLVLDKSV